MPDPNFLLTKSNYWCSINYGKSVQNKKLGRRDTTLENNVKVGMLIVSRVERDVLMWVGTLMVLVAHHRTFLSEKFIAFTMHDSHVWTRRNAVIEKNLGLVTRIALRFFKKGDVPLKDLIGYGAEGLIKAVDGFEQEKGCKFSSYAGTCIQNTIRRLVIENEYFIRLPEHQVKEKNRKKKAATKAYVKKGKTPLFSDDMTPKVSCSLDDGIQGDDGDNLSSNSLVDTRPTAEEIVLCRSKESYEKKATRLLEAELSPREWLILSCRFGIGTDEPATLEKIGSILGISRNRVCVIEKGLLVKARKKLVRNNFTAKCFF